jgi:molecular chaperone HscB
VHEDPLGRSSRRFLQLLWLVPPAEDRASDLEQRFRSLSRQFHPDYFYNAEPAERRASLERSSYLNDAYRTLRQPISRVEYLLQLEGWPRVDRRKLRNRAAGALECRVALNEELDEVRELRAGSASAEEWKDGSNARASPSRQSVEHEQQLESLSAAVGCAA